MNWRLATDQQLITIISYDDMARLSDIVAAREEFERRSQKIPKIRKNWREKVVYPR